jgi:CheY-like chemotaxis protein
LAKESRVDEIRSRFRNEVDEHVKVTESLVKQFSHSQTSVDQLIAATRHLHAIKGTAPLVGAKAVSELARTVEECLKAVVADPAIFSSSLSKTIYAALGLMRRQTGEFVDGKPISDGSSVIADLRALVPASRVEDDVLAEIEAMSAELRNSIGDTQRASLRREVSQNKRILVLTFKPRRAAEDLAKLRHAVAGSGSILSVASTADGTMHALIVSERAGVSIEKELSEFGAVLKEVTTRKGESRGDVPAPGDIIAPPPTGDPGTTRVLFVDDSAVSRDLFRMFLKRNGFETDVAGDGEEAIEKLKTARYDAVITDDQMPVMSGIELVQALRDGGSYTRIPIIVISGQVTDAARKKAMGAGANAYLIKGDFAKDQLLAILKEELQKTRSA